MNKENTRHMIAIAKESEDIEGYAKYSASEDGGLGHIGGSS